MCVCECLYVCVCFMCMCVSVNSSTRFRFLKSKVFFPLVHDILNRNIITIFYETHLQHSQFQL